MEFYLINCFNVFKEICQAPPKELLTFKEGIVVKKEILYIILDYFIILNEKEIFERVFDIIINYSENSNISYKFFVILKNFV